VVRTSAWAGHPSTGSFARASCNAARAAGRFALRTSTPRTLTASLPMTRPAPRRRRTRCKWPSFAASAAHTPAAYLSSHETLGPRLSLVVRCEACMGLALAARTSWPPHAPALVPSPLPLTHPSNLASMAPRAFTPHLSRSLSTFHTCPSCLSYPNLVSLHAPLRLLDSIW
jgi:hypothetical protein